jgi:hypothetical protein
MTNWWTHLQQDIAAERERVAAAAGVNQGGRWRRGGSTSTDRATEPLQRLTARLETAQQRLDVAERKVSARGEWDDEHLPELARGVAAGDELAWRQQGRQVAQEVDAPEIKAQAIERNGPVLARTV